MLRQRSRAKIAVAVMQIAIKRSAIRRDAAPVVAKSTANAIRSVIRDGPKRSAKKINPKRDVLIKKMSRSLRRLIQKVKSKVRLRHSAFVRSFGKVCECWCDPVCGDY